MATLSHERHFDHSKFGIQKVCIAIGLIFLITGVAGFVFPGMLGLHLSAAHNIIHIATGVLALLVGNSVDPGKAFTFSIAFGSVYGLLGILGFVLGRPGYPAVGHMASDRRLLRVIPNILEFGTNDHALHVFLAAVLLLSALLWKRSMGHATRSLIKVQSRVKDKK